MIKRPIPFILHDSPWRPARCAQLAALLLLTAAGAPGSEPPAQTRSLSGLSALESGEWTFSEKGVEVSRLCVSNPAQLLQPRHPGALCKRYVLDDKRDHIDISYDCGQAGQGRTALRIETARLVQIDAQGIANGTPFSQRLEARRTGTCRAAALAR